MPNFPISKAHRCSTPRTQPSRGFHGRANSSWTNKRERTSNGSCSSPLRLLAYDGLCKLRLHVRWNVRIISYICMYVCLSLFFLCCGRSRSKARSWQWEKREKSVQKVWNPLASQTRQTMEKPTQQKETRQQRRHANLPARFALRPQRKQRNNTKRGRSHTKQKTTQIHGDCLRHDRVKPTVSPKYAQTN